MYSFRDSREILHGWNHICSSQTCRHRLRGEKVYDNDGATPRRAPHAEFIPPPGLTTARDHHSRHHAVRLGVLDKSCPGVLVQEKRGITRVHCSGARWATETALGLTPSRAPRHDHSTGKRGCGKARNLPSRSRELACCSRPTTAFHTPN